MTYLRNYLIWCMRRNQKLSINQTYARTEFALKICLCSFFNPKTKKSDVISLTAMYRIYTSINLIILQNFVLAVDFLRPP